MKIIKIESCGDCEKKINLRFREDIKCPMLYRVHSVYGIEKDCPLDYYQKQKTIWKPINLIQMEIGVEYWILDKDNLVGRGTLNENGRISHKYDHTPDGFGTCVMFAEIKPPSI